MVEAQIRTELPDINLQQPLEQSVGAVFIPGNDVTILRNGVEIFPAMLKAVEGALRTITFETYVYWHGPIAERFADSLAEAASRGVTVRVLLDAHGAKPMRDSLKQLMLSAGVELRYFRPLNSWRVWNFDNRTHRKVLVVDDEIAFTGGVGIAEEWEGDARSPDEWRDTHVRVAGPAALPLQTAFYDNWNEAGDWHPHDPQAVPEPRANGVPVMPFRASSTIGWTDMATMIRTMVYHADSEIRLVSAYFVPDEPLVDLLKEAIERGVSVKILIPGPHTDSRLSQLAGSDAVERLLIAGARIWKYQKTMLHAKIVTVDGEVSLIGSPNLNRRSMGKDEECGVVILSESIAGLLNEHFDDDSANGLELDTDAWLRRGTLRKLKERAARVIIDQL